jgi:hypothetical protein
VNRCAQHFGACGAFEAQKACGQTDARDRGRHEDDREHPRKRRLEHAAAIGGAWRERDQQRVLSGNGEPDRVDDGAHTGADRMQRREQDLVEPAQHHEDQEHDAVEIGHQVVRLEAFDQRLGAVARGNAVAGGEQQAHRREQQHRDDDGGHESGLREMHMDRMRGRKQAEDDPTFRNQARNTHARRPLLLAKVMLTLQNAALSCVRRGCLGLSGKQAQVPGWH